MPRYFFLVMKFLLSKQYIAWYFLIPVLIIHFLVVALPSVLSLALALTDWNGFGKINYIGLRIFMNFLMIVISKKLFGIISFGPVYF